MKALTAMLIGFAILLPARDATASGPVGVYAVLEKVVFEPNEQSPERIQVWGAFAFVEGGIRSGTTASAPQRGYLYFTMPLSASESQGRTIRTEWADLKAVAGTGQAIAFGNWGFIGGFSVEGGNQVFVTVQTGEGSFRGIPLHVLNQTPPATDPVPYITNTGIVKLANEGSHAAVVKRLKDSLKQ